MAWLLGLIGTFIGAFLGGTVLRDEMGWISAVFGAAIGVLFARVLALRDQVKSLREGLHGLGIEQAAHAAQTAQGLQAAMAAIARRPAAPPAAASDAAPVSAAPARASVLELEPLEPAPAAEPQRPVAATAAAPLLRSAPADLPTLDLPELDPILMTEPPPPPPKPGRAVFDIGAAPPQKPAPKTPPPVPRATRPAPPRPAVSRVPDEPDFIERAIGAIKRWFTEGNIPVKIGVLVLFLGVGALMKYAADQGWFTVPIEMRLGGIALAAIAGLIFGWRKRDSHRSFALSLQGGAIGMLLLVVFGSYKLYGLIPPSLAFVLLIVIVAAAGILAVLQDALALALLAIVGGFLAPILTASDSGNHVALFTYYAVLNAAIFAIAWVKPWRALNLLGFVFTFGIGTAWGLLKYKPELFASTEPFLILFYAFYLIIPLLYALRQPEGSRGLVDGSLVFGTPLLAFPLQAALLQGDAMSLALSALVLAIAHMAIAWFAFRRLAMTVLGQSHALLALGFATLAVPLALSARATACAWAVEGAALVWLGLRQQRQLPRVAGYLLQLAAGGSMLIALGGRDPLDTLLPLLNGNFLALLLISLAGFASARLEQRADASSVVSKLLFAWGLIWWLLTGLHEIDRFAAPGQTANLVLGFAALTTLLAAETARRLNWSEFRYPAYAGIVIAPLFIAATAAANPNGPLSDYGMLAWAGWFAASLRSQRNLQQLEMPALSSLHFIHCWTWIALFSAQLIHLSRVQWQLSTIWQVLLALLPAALAFGGTLARWAVVRFPLSDAAERARPVLLATLASLLGLFWVLGLVAEGNPLPLPYLPIVNPLELAQIAFVLALLGWFRQAGNAGEAILDAQFRAQALAVVGFALLTSVTLRSVHFLGDVPWDEALLHSALAQAALSVVWCATGLAAMLIGARRVSRPIWIGGAVLVGLVIVKLILIDRTHLKDIYAILGVLAVGSLLMVVGYFAPNPPKQAGEVEP
ncbi:putative membrane protein [Tahibacter aquaticus]|uniref:Putative membrane protein n=1 Tax=Tahibacter aquaticus TaxID=520092 RepID=A0A4R6YQQ9_9GAMM|nr:DUF2339 domain-containing protein [Tahibacter aquaticus]TDR40337.1 putative membrane protein [Tahibacter aquaticus]